MNEKELKIIDWILALITTVTGIMTAFFVFPLYLPGRIWVCSAIATLVYKIYYRRI